MPEAVCRLALETALSLYARQDREDIAKAFLQALSVDELLFLAQFLGSCILITATINMSTWDAVYHRAKAAHRRLGGMSVQRRDDAAHKLMLLSEFAACCGFRIQYRS